MNHRIKGRKLGRDSSHRKSLMRNLAIALFENGLIKTTLPKAKELRPFVEKVISKSRVDNLSNRRLVLSILGSDKVHDILFSQIGKGAASRNGGYVRILKFGFRSGDKAPMAIVELVDRDANSLKNQNSAAIEN